VGWGIDKPLIYITFHFPENGKTVTSSRQQSSLKPGDLVVALRLALYPNELYERLADALTLSLSAAHRAVSRLLQSGLLLPNERRANKSALGEFLVHGVPYAFPAQLGPETRGVPTAASLPDFAADLPSESGAVWPSIEGVVRGPSLTPLHDGVPGAALRDHRLHRLLALTDALRLGGARERRIAEQLLVADFREA
jgi:hypothetical protein